MRLHPLALALLLALTAVPGNLPAQTPNTPTPVSPSYNAPTGRVLRVALYTDTGSKTGGDAVEKCLNLAPGQYTCFRVTAADIRNGALEKADVLVQGGGSGSAQAKALTPEGCEKIKQFVKNGGGYIGICAGAYLASSYYPWSLHIISTRVIDREHWARGGGDVQLKFSDSGKTRFSLAESEVTCRYNQGPLMGRFDEPGLPAYEELATFGTEIAKKGAPKGVMIGTTAIAAAPFGNGKVLCISPHPEATKGLDGVIRNAVQWVAPAKPLDTP